MFVSWVNVTHCSLNKHIFCWDIHKIESSKANTISFIPKVLYRSKMYIYMGQFDPLHVKPKVERPSRSSAMWGGRRPETGTMGLRPQSSTGKLECPLQVKDEILSRRDQATYSLIRVEPLLLCVERSQMRWLRHLIRMPPRCHPGTLAGPLTFGLCCHFLMSWHSLTWLFLGCVFLFWLRWTSPLLRKGFKKKLDLTDVYKAPSYDLAGNLSERLERYEDTLTAFLTIYTQICDPHFNSKAKPFLNHSPPHELKTQSIFLSFFIFAPTLRPFPPRLFQWQDVLPASLGGHFKYGLAFKCARIKAEAVCAKQTHFFFLGGSFFMYNILCFPML